MPRKEKQTKKALTLLVNADIGGIKMNELINKFLNKDVIIYSMSSENACVEGIITDITENWITVKDKTDCEQIINLEYVTRIREYPKNKNGKKKSVVLD